MTTQRKGRGKAQPAEPAADAPPAEAPAETAADPVEAQPAEPADAPPAGRVRVRILQGVAGLDFSWSPGEEVAMSEEQAQVWADGYRGERVDNRVDAEGRAGPERAARRSRGGGRDERPETLETRG